MQDDEKKQLPKTYQAFAARFPELVAAHEQVGKAVDEAGPLPDKTQALIKLGICVGAGLETALRSHVRRAMGAGATVQEVEQAIALGMNTVGFPRTVMCWSWAQAELART